MDNTSGSDLFVIILLGFFLMLLMVSFIIIMVIYHRQRQLENRQKVVSLQAAYENTLLNAEKEIREETLTHVGRELHDNIGQMLSLAKINLSSSKPTAISEGKSIINDVIKEVRSLSKSLNLDWVEAISLEEFIKRELEKIEKSGYCKVSFTHKGEILDLQKDHKLILIRMIQETLNNALKHAAPDLISIEINNSSDKSTISIQDDGAGFDTNIESTGSGMYNLRKRMETIEGEIDISSKLDKGTVITLYLPK